MNVAIYLRKSREELDETREETLARHERILKDFCDSHGLTIKRIYREVVSGESIANRPQMMRMLEDVSEGLYDGVAVIEIERLSRGNQIDQAEILEIFKKSGTKILTLNKTYDLSDENEFDEDFFEFGLFMSRREYKIIKRRLLRGKKQAQKEGYFIGSQCPFGYTKKRSAKGYVLVPDENADLVRSCFTKFAYDGNSLADIKNWLNGLGIKPNSVKSAEWESHRIRRMLKNKVYIGMINTDTGKETSSSYVGKHEPLIDERTFALCQERFRQASTKVKKGKELKNPLASLLKCGVCGRAVQRYVRKGKEDVFNCSRSGCSNVMSVCRVVEEKVISELQEELKGFNYFLENHAEEIRDRKAEIDRERSLLEGEILKKEAMAERCCELLEEGIYSKEKYLARVAVIEEDTKALRQSLNALESVNVDDCDRVSQAIPILENVLREYWNLSIEGRNAILRTIVSRIEYTKTERNRCSKTKNQSPDLIDLKIFMKI